MYTCKCIQRVTNIEDIERTTLVDIIRKKKFDLKIIMNNRINGKNTLLAYKTISKVYKRLIHMRRTHPKGALQLNEIHHDLNCDHMRKIATIMNKLRKKLNTEMEHENDDNKKEDRHDQDNNKRQYDTEKFQHNNNNITQERKQSEINRDGHKKYAKKYKINSKNEADTNDTTNKEWSTDNNERRKSFRQSVKAIEKHTFRGGKIKFMVIWNPYNVRIWEDIGTLIHEKKGLTNYLIELRQNKPRKYNNILKKYEHLLEELELHNGANKNHHLD